MFALIVYGAVLHWTFEQRIAPVFGYAGTHYRSPDPLNYLLVGMLLAVAAVFLPRRIETPADWMLWVLFIVTGLPSALVAQYLRRLTPGEALVLGVVVSLVFLSLSLLGRISPGTMRISVPISLVWIGITFFSLLTYAWVSATFGLAIVRFDLGSIYDLRAAYAEGLDGARLLGYLIRYQGSVINPFLMAAGVVQRRPALIVVGALGQAALFSVTGFKLFYFAIPAVIAVALLLRKGRVLTDRLVAWGVIATSVLAIVVDEIRGGPLLWIELIIDRMIIFPAMLTSQYLWVYADRPKHVWSYSIINPFSPDTYGGRPPGIVVADAFGGGSNSNANFIADGYANLGWTGVLIETVVLVAILWLLNATGRHLPLSIVAPTLMIPALTIVNGSSFTSFLTGGVLAACLLMACLPSEGWATRSRAGSEPEQRQPTST